MTGATRRGQLFRKYVVVLLVLVGGVLMASSLVELSFAYKETQRAILRVERARAAAAAASIERFLREVEQQVRETTRTASDDPDASQVGPGWLGFQEGLGAALAEQRELDFARALRNVPAIAELGHLDVAGKEQLRVSRLDPDVVGSQEDFSRAPRFTEPRAGRTYWSPVYFRNDVEPYLTLAVPSGKYAVEVTTAEVSLGAVLRLAAQIEVGPGGHAYVVDSRDQLVAHPDARLLRARRDLSAFVQVRAARAEHAGAAGEVALAPAAMVAEGLGGKRVLAAHAAIAPLGWLVFVERPAADAYAPLRAPVARSAAIFVLGLALSILASVLLARRMVAPIRVLEEGAARIGAGDLAHRIEVRTGDELEALGEAFNQAAARLEDAYATLEQKVATRTRELAAANAGLTEALEQQTATAEILRAIAGSPTDIQPVLETVVRAAARFCGAPDVLLLRLDGAVLRAAAADGAFHDVLVGQVGRLERLEVPVTRGSVTGRALLDQRTIHVHDLAAVPEDEFPEGHELQLRFGHHTMAGTPLLREGRPLGVLALCRMAVDPFSDKQLELLRVFADQAVIAIENVRLFTEVQARNRDLTVALERQTATGEVLKVISRSTFDLRPVLDAVIESATRLCGAARGHIFRFDGECLRFAAAHGAWPGFREYLERHPVRLGPGSVAGRAGAERRTVHVPDVLREPGYEHTGLLEQQDHRAVLAVPMLREGALLGVVVILRVVPEPFTDSQVELVSTFADQAVIAIENVRLFQELEARNRDLTETLEQQTATSEILRVISQSPTDVQPVFDTIAANALRLCGATWSAVLRFDGQLMHLASHHNVGGSAAMDALRRAFPRPPRPGGATDRAILTRTLVHVSDVLADPEYQVGGLAQATGYRSIVSVPMLREGQPAGAITVTGASPEAFSRRQVGLLRTFADQAVIAIENVRLFTELEARNQALAESLEQQTATSEILRVISRCQTDVQPVFDAIAAKALDLCRATTGWVYTFDGELIHVAAAHGLSPEGIEARRKSYPMSPSRAGGTSRAVLTRRTVYIPDIREDPEYALQPLAEAAAYLSVLAVPMLREGKSIGVITVTGAKAGAFSPRQMKLLETFADQGAIAIENVHLFRELETRTRDLTRSVGELRALGEVSQAVSSTLDLETVLSTIVSRAVQLSGSDGGLVYEFEEATQTFQARASHRIAPEHLEAVRAAPIRLGEGAVGRAGVIREPVEVADIEDERQLVAPQVRGLLVRGGLGSLLAVPLVRDGRLLGGFVILRRERGAFSAEVVATLQTFAAQSVLAIQNARLFREIQRQKEYADALVETSPVAIATMDLDGTVVGWNPGAERLFGYAPAEALGRRMEELVATPEVREDVRANIRRTAGGEGLRTMGRRARKDGTLVDVEISGMPVTVEGARVGMIATYHDITGLLRARREAEAANEAKSAFLATMSHEIRTPMNAVVGMSGLLLGTDLTDEQREYAEVVRQSGDALLTVINDILDFSKIEAGKLELESQPFDLRGCVESALDLVATRAAEKDLDLAYVVAEGTPAAIVGDVTRLRQVLLNLLSNAVKFTERGEVVLSLSARGPDGATPLHELTFSVRDTGIGIPPDRLGRLFRSFSQVDASTTRRYGGTGLGLAISQRLAELMGGRIAVSSEVAAGSDFRLIIRAAAAEAPATRRDLSGVQPSLRGKRVLAVDDNATNRRILGAHLDAWGMTSRATESPPEALAWIAAGERFDVGILDMHMPDMDGVTLARAMREHPTGARVPLILFTSLGRREARAEGEGFAAYLPKPIKPSQLFDALVSVLGERPVHVRERAAGRAGLDPEMARRHPLRILLAEDNVVNQKVALRLLGQMGYRADVAANGLEAVAALERQVYDVVLMDVQMPELDGLEASREIGRRWPGDRRPRIVAMTANALQGDRELCVAAGMDDYVSKPIRVEELVAALERCPRPGDAGGRDRATGAVPGAEDPAPAPGRPQAAGAGAPADAPVRVGPAGPGAVGGASTREPAPASPARPAAAPAPATPRLPASGAETSAGTAGRSVGGEGTPPPAAAIDRAAFARLTAAMGREFAAELVETFAQDARELVATLERALAAADVDAFRRAAHSLKSTSESLGATSLATLARALEAMARAGRLEGAADRLAQLARAHEAAAGELEEIRRDLSA